MIDQETESNILRLFQVEGWKVGTIARQLDIHHSVVDRVLRTAGVPRAIRRRRSIADPYVPFMKATLEKYPTLPASRLYEMVRKRGYPGQPDHFRSVVRRYRPKQPAEAYLRLRTLPGEQAQVDWAHFGRIAVGNAMRPLMAFIMVLSWSRQLFLRFFLDQRMGSFLRGHQDAFQFFNGVPRVLLYDNLKSAVIERRGDAIRFNETLLAFAAHYRYEPRPVAPYRGNEKGRVERAIRYARDSFFPAREFNDIDDLNRQALQWSTGIAAERRWPDDRTRIVREVFLEEREKLLALPDDLFPVEDRVEVSVGKTPYARFDRNDYSVPHDRVRRSLTVLASTEQVRILDGSEVVAVHVRSWDKGAQVEDPSHIENLEAQKREARQSRGMDRLYHAAPSTQQLMVKAAERGTNLGALTNGLTRILDRYGAEEFEAAVKEVVSADAPHLAALRQVLDRRAHNRGRKPPVPVHLPDDPRVRNLVVRPHSLDSYDTVSKDEPEGGSK